jgi:hypothetical protein
MLKIDDAIKILTEIRKKEGNLRICRIGHFGEINDFGKYDFNVYRNARPGTFGNDGPPEDVVDIWAPDIGPEPV